MKAIPILLLVSACISCNPQNRDADKPSSQQADSKNASTTHCYAYASVTDTILLTIIRTGDSVTGTLVYRLGEKDSNTGTIRGKISGEILVADYKFMSEGMLSIRQVAFKKEGEVWVEGYGEYTNPGSLVFNSFMKLTSVACP